MMMNIVCYICNEFRWNFNKSQFFNSLCIFEYHMITSY